jgi:hypothetical protein
MQIDGVAPKQLSVLHGQLIAFDWIEQNTGQAIARPEGTVSSCYRITVTGLREYRRIHGGDIVEERLEEQEKPRPRLARKKKPKCETPDALAAVS